MPSPNNSPPRIASVDAYRGFVMLAMASGGLSIAGVLRGHPEIVGKVDQTNSGIPWETMWRTLAYQLDHVFWTGCGFWDLIQPSFMFLVGVAMPFSFARRSADGSSRLARFAHVLWRSVVLVLLGVFLSSNWSQQTNFTFVNVLTQIGLGYPFLYLFLGKKPAVQWAGVAAILVGYWFFFYQYSIPATETDQLRAYLTDKYPDKPERVAQDFGQYSGVGAHWNKHTNAAAAIDRKFLNLFPREEKEWHGARFWVNDGGYQTLNFIPSLATMLLGLLAGERLRSGRTPRQVLAWLLLAGGGCLLAGLALDTRIWPIHVPGCDWSLCPVVKRIWTPSWALFSTGWTLWMLAAFYWVMDVKGWKRWAFPLTVVGMNSIAIYCMSQLLKPWIGKTLKTHLATIDQLCDTSLNWYLFDSLYGPIRLSAAVVLSLWLACYWMYRQRIFVRI